MNLKKINKMKNFEEFENELKEGFDPMVGVNHLLNDPFMTTLLAAWILNGKISFNNLKENSILMINDFITYANSLGYTIDKETLNYKFNELVDKARSILKK